MAPEKPDRENLSEIEELRTRLAEAEETLRAIHEGEVDAVVVSGSKGEQIFSLTGSDSIYRLIVETMNEAAFTISFDGKIFYCNARFGDFVKRPMEQVVGHSLQEFVDSANHPAVSALLAATQQQPLTQRLVLRDSQGQSVPVHVSANVLNQPDGLSICIVATDLTELENSTEMIHRLRRQQEALKAANAELAATEEQLRVQNEELAASREELDRARARYQDLFETAPDGYISTDAEGNIQEVNKAAAIMFGSDGADLKGNPFSALLPMSERDNYHQLLAKIIAAENPLPKWELELAPSERLPFWAAISAAASYDDEGRITGLRWLIRDVTEKKESEKGLRQANETLEVKVQERTAELSQRAAQLRALFGELTLSEQRERRRLAKVLHDHLQQLLVAAKMRSSLLGRNPDPMTKQGAQEIENLISEAIDASRSLTLELSPPVLHEGGLTAGVEWLARRMREKHGLAVDLTLEGDLPPLAEDVRTLLFESIRELLFNTVKHAHGPAKVHIRQSGERELHISVSDAGPGFDPARLGVAGGGFGLSSIRERLGLIGGRMIVESAPGSGSNFTLVLPLNLMEPLGRHIETISILASEKPYKAAGEQGS